MGNCSEKCQRNTSNSEIRRLEPNHLYPDVSCSSKQHPNYGYKANQIKTTKYNVFTFLPKNLYEQFHRLANIYFLFIVLLNWVPSINAVAKEVAMIPLVLVLAVTAAKDILEDLRRYKSDRKINSKPCRMYNR